MVTLMERMNILSEKKRVVKLESPTNLGGLAISKSVKPIGRDISTGTAVKSMKNIIKGASIP